MLNSRFKVFLRPTLAIVFGFIGAFIARIVIPFDPISFGGLTIIIVAGLAFCLLGFILPEFSTWIAAQGVSAIALQIVKNMGGPIHFGSPRVKKKETLSPILVDTSVLVDGRIADIVKSGFLNGTFMILPSVVSELHMLADGADPLKRTRGRRGLDALSEIKKERSIKVQVLSREPDDSEVDDKLVTLAKKLKAAILTVDFNLNKVASIKGVRVLNINELANAVKVAILPGEELDITITAAGSGKDQGVGFLDDGTMVVVEDAAQAKGKSLTVRVAKVLQTAAGKMIFAKAKRY